MRYLIAVLLVFLAGTATGESPSEVQILLNRASKLWAASSGDPSAAERVRGILVRAEALSPFPAEIWFLWGEIAFATERIGHAAVAYETAWRRGHQPARSKAMLARSLFRQGTSLYQRRAESKAVILEIFLRAHALTLEIVAEPGLSPAMREEYRRLEFSCLMNLAAVRRWMGDLPEATRLFEKIAAMQPKNYRHQINLARAYKSALNWEKALTATRRAVELNPDPDWLEPHALLASIHSRLANPQLAEHHFAVYLAEKPEDVGMLAQLGGHYVREGKFGAGAEILLRVVEIDATRRKALHSLAYALRRLGRTEEAKKYEEAYRKLDEKTMAERDRKSGTGGTDR